MAANPPKKQRLNNWEQSQSSASTEDSLQSVSDVHEMVSILGYCMVGVPHVLPYLSLWVGCRW